MNKPTEKLLEERGSTYGDIYNNVTCCKELMRTYTLWREKNNLIHGVVVLKENAHNEIMRLVFHKIARIATGAFHEDNYDDVCGYIQLAKQQLKSNG